MQVGDLVELSTSAKKLKWAKRFIGKIGVVTSMRYVDWIKVNWCGHVHQSIFLNELFSRSNLKHAKTKKS